MSYSLSPKENFLTVVRDHKTPEYTPVEGDASMWVAGGSPIEKGDVGITADPFGVMWYVDHNEFGAIPAPGEFLLQDVTEWKKVVTIPNVDDFDWEKLAEEDLAHVNRDVMAVAFCSGVGPYERLAALMGFEGALIAMATEPEATFEILNAFGDFKIAVMKKAAQYYKPESFKLFDDVATARSPFMSLEMYDELISPVHKKVYDACWEADILPDKHVCGCWDALLPAILDEGIAMISAVQPENDIVGILEKHGHEFAVIGGFDTQGAPGYTNDVEIVRAERVRNANEYAIYDGFIYAPLAEGLMKRYDDDGNVLSAMEQMMSLGPISAEDAEYFRSLGSPASRR